MLRDGHTVHVRPITPDDADRLGRFHARQSPESVYFRFFTPRPVLSERELEYFTRLDHHDRVAFVALLEGEIIGVARYERYAGTDTAEIAFFTDDAHNGRGIATLLLEYLVAAGRQRGLRRFTASTLPNNRKMLKVFARAGFEVSSRLDEGAVAIGFDIIPTDESVRAAESRRLEAEAASVRRLVRPESVVVVGPRGDDAPGSQGGARGESGGVRVRRPSDAFGDLVLRGLLGHGFAGRTSALSPAGGPAAVPEGAELVEEIPERTDLAVIAAPAGQVAGIVEECGRRGVGAIAILSPAHGAGTTGTTGATGATGADIVRSARRHGIRVLGPDCIGVVNTDPEVRLHATIAPHAPPVGSIGVMAEAGALAVSVLEHARHADLGISTFVAAGDAADVGPADLLSYWAEDARTSGVLLYLRSTSLDPRLVRAVRAASLAKPVAALGEVMLSGAEAGEGRIRRRLEALSRQTGLISVATLEQLFDIGRLLAEQPVPAGDRVAVVGNSAGAVALGAAACRSAGLDVLPSGGGLDLDATAKDYAAALADVCASGGADAVLVVHSPIAGLGSGVEDQPGVFPAVAEASAAAPGVTFAAAVVGESGVSRIEAGDGTAVPVFRFPERAALALGRLATYGTWRSTAVHGTSTPGVSDLAAARRVVEAALGRAAGGEPVQLDLAEQDALLGAYSVPVAARRVVSGPQDAVAAAQEIRWPVALKAAARDRGMRSAESGVAIDINDAVDLVATWERMEAALGERMGPVVVQRFIPRGVDASVRVRRTGAGAGLVEAGLGGPVTAFDEPQVGLLPLTLGDAQSLVAGSALGRALPDPLDRVALVGIVHRLAHLVVDLEDVVEVVADPVVASVDGAWVADVRVTVHHSEALLDAPMLT